MLPEQPTGPLPVKKFSHFMEPKVHFCIHHCPSPVTNQIHISAVHAPHSTSWRFTV